MSKKKFSWRQLIWLWLSALVIVLDQLTKKIAFVALMNGTTKIELPILNFSLAFNRGAAFSFLNAASGWQNLFFIGLASVFSLLLVFWLLQSLSNLQSFSIALIIGGAIGNVIDRLHYGFVIDFIDLHIGQHHWPTFNVADSAICVGVFFLVVSNIWRTRKE